MRQEALPKQGARRHFTDRKKSIRHFVSYLNDDQATEKILFFHGDGGNGKTLLLKFLKEKCCKRLGADNWEYVKSLEGDAFIENFAGAAGCTAVLTMAPGQPVRIKKLLDQPARQRIEINGRGERR